MNKIFQVILLVLLLTLPVHAETPPARQGDPLDDVFAILDKTDPAKKAGQSSGDSKRSLRPAMYRPLRYRTQSAKRSGASYYVALKSQLQHKTETIRSGVANKIEGAKNWGRSTYNSFHRALRDTENRVQNVVDKLQQLSYIEGKVREYEDKARELAK